MFALSFGYLVSNHQIVHKSRGSEHQNVSLAVHLFNTVCGHECISQKLNKPTEVTDKFKPFINFSLFKHN